MIVKQMKRDGAKYYERKDDDEGFVSDILEEEKETWNWIRLKRG